MDAHNSGWAGACRAVRLSALSCSRAAGGSRTDEELTADKLNYMDSRYMREITYSAATYITAQCNTTTAAGD